MLPASKYAGYGYFTYQAQDIPPPTSEGGAQYGFRINHMPEPHNYHHCEIHTYVDGEPMPEERAAPKAVRKHFRTMLARKVVLVREPEI